MRVAIDYSLMGAYVISMYLPLTGYREKTSLEERMSIESIGPKIDPQAVNAADGAHKPEQQKQERVQQEADQQDLASEISEEKKQEAVDGFYSAGSMNTEDFVVLRSQGTSDTLEVLDEVIESMKEKIEEVGEAIETLSKMTEKTSKDRVGLQVLEKTLDAIDKYKNNE
jgi:ParB-like chromosome segregation protein Spo0J